MVWMTRYLNQSWNCVNDVIDRVYLSNRFTLCFGKYLYIDFPNPEKFFLSIFQLKSVKKLLSFKIIGKKNLLNRRDSLSERDYFHNKHLIENLVYAYNLRSTGVYNIYRNNIFSQFSLKKKVIINFIKIVQTTDGIDSRQDWSNIRK